MDTNKLLKSLEDDFQTKADKQHDIAKEYYSKGEYELAVVHDRQAHAFEYCAAVVRMKIDG